MSASKILKALNYFNSAYGEDDDKYFNLRAEAIAEYTELSQLQTQLDRYKRISESGESLGGQIDEMEKRMELEAQLAATQETLSQCKRERDEANKTLYNTIGPTLRKVTAERDRGRVFLAMALSDLKASSQNASRLKHAIDGIEEYLKATDNDS